MAGARFISRGIDDNSNVANFVETEIIVTYEQNLYSFVQIRGSIPIFWEQKQKKLNSIISIKRNEDLTSQAFEGHMKDLVDDFSRIVMINLVKRDNHGEEALTESLIKLLKMYPKREVKHIWFDFHSETHGDNFHKLNNLILEVRNVQTRFGFFVKERFGG